MNRVEKYCYDVLNGKIKAGNSIKFSVKRFLNDLEKSKNNPNFPYYFDENSANEIINFAETLVLAEGSNKKPLKLYPFQTFILMNIHGWRYKNNSSIRRFRESYVQISRQCGKSMLSGVLVSFYSNFQDYQYPQCYLCATKMEQAKIVFNEIKKFLNADAELGEMFRIQDWKSEIQCKNTNGVIKCLGRDTKSLDGL